MQATIDEGLDGLYNLWDELGIEENAKDDRNQVVRGQLLRLLTK
jgi:hypothetical protein